MLFAIRDVLTSPKCDADGCILVGQFLLQTRSIQDVLAYHNPKAHVLLPQR